ncbi:M20 family metallopeptidase [Brachyspira alvinipulli]|uniref:M20 family metallopeptidase n=1 Tax=Brachyspira alvinipulli TaxID=84379 RepID=UPI0004B915A0|nr:M20 family metallopeptidase [Brachyspira alvinipulli]
MNKELKKTIELLDELIKFDTSNPVGNEKECALYLENVLKSFGFTTSVQIIDGYPNRANLVASIGSKFGKKLMYNGHLDVVPPGDNWKTSPFNITLKDNKIYGRGTCDMKGGIASMVSAALQLVEDGFNFDNGELILVFVADEELNNLGMKHYLKSSEFVKADYAIISEPTNGEFCIAHRGVARYEISIKGVSCHAGVPANGINAIVNASHAVIKLDELNNKLSLKKHEILPPPTLVPTIINGGTKDNVLPDVVRINVDRRTLPDEDQYTCMKEIEDSFSSLKNSVNGFNYEIKPYIYLKAGYISKNSEIVNECSKVYKNIFNREAVANYFAACNEQNFLIEAGIPTIIYGPGDLNQAHTVDEFVTTDSLYESTKFFYEFAKSVLS